MKKLFLLRHAQAEGTTVDARLTALGRKEAEKAREYIQENNLIPEMILCSPAIRTRNTCEIIFSDSNTKPNILIEDSLYGINVEDLIKLINATSDDINHLMIISHNPSITALITELKGLKHDLSYSKALNYTPTCKLMQLAFETSKWSDIQNALCVLEQVYWPMEGYTKEVI